MDAITVPADQMYDILTGNRKWVPRIWNPRKKGKILLCSATQKKTGYASGTAFCTAEIGSVTEYPPEYGEEESMFVWNLKKVRFIEPFLVRSRNRLSFFEVKDVHVQELKRISAREYIEVYYDPIRYWR